MENSEPLFEISQKCEKAININMAAGSNYSHTLVNNDQNFIYLSYQKILGRAPDQESLEYFLERLQMDDSKIQILSQLYSLRIDRTFDSDLIDLNTVIKKYKISKYPLIGWIFRKFGGKKLKEQIEQQMRLFEYNIFPKFKENSDHSNNTYETDFASCILLKKIKQITTNPHDGSATERTNELLEEFNKLNIFPSNTDNIYCRLKFALIAHKERLE